MLAIIESGGKQYQVSAGDTIMIERLTKKAGETVEFADVKLLIDDQNNPIKPGANSKVFAKVVKEEVKGKKQVVFRFRRRKDSKTKSGHRQRYTLVKIENIQQ